MNLLLLLIYMIRTMNMAISTRNSSIIMTTVCYINYTLWPREKKSCLWSFSDFLHIRASDRDTITQWEKFINVKPLDSFPWDIFNLLPIAPLKLMIKNNNKIQNKRSKLANVPFSYFIYFIFNLWRNLCIYIKY